MTLFSLHQIQSDTQDQIFLHWASGESAQMHILVVHAMVILLTYGEPRGKERRQLFVFLMRFHGDTGDAKRQSGYIIL